MKTISIAIENLTVPCSNYCRYCLLSCNNNVNTTDCYETEKFIRRIAAEIKQKDMPFNYYIGYCMDTPYLNDYIRLCREYGFSSADFLQLNGLKFRNLASLNSFISLLKDNGIKLVNLTFYGTREYHDRFSGRKGDFDYMCDIIRMCNRLHVPVEVSAPVIKENMDQAEELYDFLNNLEISHFFFFLPHSKGRGFRLEDQRLTDSDYESLPEIIKANFALSPLKTEREWLELNDFPQEENRILTMVLRNGTDYLNLTADEIISRLTEKDDLFYSQMPDNQTLAEMYGDLQGNRLYRKRDLIVRYRQLWARDHPELTATIEEYRDFSIRY